MRYFVELLRPLNCFISFFAVIISIFVIDPNYFLGNFVGCLLASSVVFLVCGAGNALNDYFDREVDRINHPNRPIPAGKISAQAAFIFSILLFLFSVSLSILLFFMNMIRLTTIMVTIAAISILVIYEKVTKKMGFVGNVCVSVLTGLIFVYSGTIVGEYLKSAFLFLLAFVANLGREIAKDIEDMAGDLDRFTLPMRIGVERAKGITAAIFGIAIILSPFPYFLFSFSLKYLLVVTFSDILFIVASIMMFYNVKRAQRVSKFAMVVGLLAYLFGRF